MSDIEAIVAEYFPAQDARLINRRVFTEPEFRSALTRAAEGRWVHVGEAHRFLQPNGKLSYVASQFNEMMPAGNHGLFVKLPTPPTD